MRGIKVIFVVIVASLFACQESEDIQLKQDNGSPLEVSVPDGFEAELLTTIDYDGRFIEMQFIDDMVGYVLGSAVVGGYVDVFKTQDGGTTWVNMEPGKQEIPGSMFFTDAETGFISFYGLNTGLIKTSDGGETWEVVTYPELTGMMYHIQEDKDGNLYSMLMDESSNVQLFKSEDAAQTWDIINNSPDIGFDLITFSFKVYDDHIYVAGKNQQLLVTDLQGTLQKKLQTEIDEIWDLEIIDGENYILTGSSKTIKSSDGGRNWKQIYDRAGRIINFENPNEGLMILNKSYQQSDVYQSNDVIGFTSDGGSSWSEGQVVSNLIKEYSDNVVLDGSKNLILVGNRLYRIRNSAVNP